MIILFWAAPILALTKEERLIIWVGVLLTVLVLGGMFIARLDRWRKRQMDELDDSPQHMGSFRAMYERGELSKAEYDRVMRRMAEHAGAKPKVASAPVADPHPTESPTREEPPPAPSS